LAEANTLHPLDLPGRVRKSLRNWGNTVPECVRPKWRVTMLAPLPLGFSQVLILKVVKVLCFDTLLQVLILKVVSWGPMACPFAGEP